MQVQRVQNNQTSFQALKGFECGKSLKPIIGETGEVIEKKLFKAFNENEYFQELCKRNDVWVDIKPKHSDKIYSGLDTDIFARPINALNDKPKEQVIGYVTAKLYKDPLYFYHDLGNSYKKHAEDIIDFFLKDVDGLKSGIKKFFERIK